MITIEYVVGQFEAKKVMITPWSLTKSMDFELMQMYGLFIEGCDTGNLKKPYEDKPVEFTSCDWWWIQHYHTLGQNFDGKENNNPYLNISQLHRFQYKDQWKSLISL